MNNMKVWPTFMERAQGLHFYSKLKERNQGRRRFGPVGEKKIQNQQEQIGQIRFKEWIGFKIMNQTPGL